MVDNWFAFRIEEGNIYGNKEIMRLDIEKTGKDPTFERGKSKQE